MLSQLVSCFRRARSSKSFPRHSWTRNHLSFEFLETRALMTTFTWANDPLAPEWDDVQDEDSPNAWSFTADVDKPVGSGDPDYPAAGGLWDVAIVGNGTVKAVSNNAAGRMEVNGNATLNLNGTTVTLGDPQLAKSDLLVASQFGNTLTVTNGTAATPGTLVAPTIQLGQQTSTLGSLLVDSSTATVNAQDIEIHQGELQITSGTVNVQGTAGTTALSVRGGIVGNITVSGGQLNVTGDTVILGGGQNNLTVTGSGQANFDKLSTGAAGAATVSVSGGGDITSGMTEIGLGEHEDDGGLITAVSTKITGVGSTWIADGPITLGQRSDLTLEASGKLQALQGLENYGTISFDRTPEPHVPPQVPNPASTFELGTSAARATFVNHGTITLAGVGDHPIIGNFQQAQTGMMTANVDVGAPTGIPVQKYLLVDGTATLGGLFNINLFDSGQLLDQHDGTFITLVRARNINGVFDYIQVQDPVAGEGDAPFQFTTKVEQFGDWYEFRIYPVSNYENEPDEDFPSDRTGFIYQAVLRTENLAPVIDVTIWKHNSVGSLQPVGTINNLTVLLHASQEGFPDYRGEVLFEKTIPEINGADNLEYTITVPVTYFNDIDKDYSLIVSVDPRMKDSLRRRGSRFATEVSNIAFLAPRSNETDPEINRLYIFGRAERDGTPNADTVTVGQSNFSFNGPAVSPPESFVEARVRLYEGNDIFSATGSNVPVVVFGGAGIDTITGSPYADTLAGADGEDTLSGGAGNDTISGGRHMDTINGNDGNDTLYGNTGNDFLYGNAGDDTLFGGYGKDELRGGTAVTKNILKFENSNDGLADDIFSELGGKSELQSTDEYANFRLWLDGAYAKGALYQGGTLSVEKTGSQFDLNHTTGTLRVTSVADALGAAVDSANVQLTATGTRVQLLGNVGAYAAAATNATDTRSRARWSLIANDADVEMYETQNLRKLDFTNASTSIVHKVQTSAWELINGERVDKNLVLSVNAGDTGTGFSISANSRLDLTNNDLIVRATSTTRDSVFDQVYGWIDQGFGNYDWAGNGVTSSTADGNPITDTALGIMKNGDLGYERFSNQYVDSDSIVVKYTYYGDIDLDGDVDGDDFAAYASYSDMSSGAKWIHGNFDYDDVRDGSDFILLVDNFEKTGL